MGKLSQPLRLPNDVYDSAAAAAPVASRSVVQQVAHWARLGREIEMSPNLNHRGILRVLSGVAPYDELDPPEQAIVQETWSERIVALREGLNFEEEFKAAGEPYSEADDDGNLKLYPGAN